MRAAIYVRLSYDPDGTSTATERQEADCRALCAERGWEVAGVYTDNDVSAFDLKTKRPAFERLLADADTYDTVVCWRTDRLARRGRDLQRYIDLDKPLTSCTEPEFTGSTGLLMLRLVSSFAEHESTTKSERVTRAERERALKGEPHRGGRRVFGYTRQFQPRPYESQFVAEAARRVLAGESLRAIVADWQDRGVKTVSGGRWTVSNFGRMLRAPVFTGLRSYRGELIEGNWPALISRPDWQLLQVVLARRPAPKAITRHLLTGLAHCAACGASMNGMAHHGAVQYKCNAERGCGRVTIRANIIEAEVVRRLVDELPAIMKRQRATARKDKRYAERLAALDRDTDALERLNTARWADETIDHATYIRQRGKLEARIADRRSELAQQQTTLRLTGSMAEYVRQFWGDVPLEEKRQILEACVERITVKPGRKDRIAISWR